MEATGSEIVVPLGDQPNQIAVSLVWSIDIVAQLIATGQAKAADVDR
jgi:hypothetical protein